MSSGTCIFRSHSCAIWHDGTTYYKITYDWPMGDFCTIYVGTHYKPLERQEMKNTWGGIVYDSYEADPRTSGNRFNYYLYREYTFPIHDAPLDVSPVPLVIAHMTEDAL